MSSSRPFDQSPRPDAPSEVEQLRTLLYTDDLTGLYNRRFFRHCIEEQKLQSEASGEPFALLIMDIDHFKQINDSYGHAVGDSALIRVAQALKDQIKQQQGWVFRYAGDEFVALLRNCTEDAARAACGRILSCISTALTDAPTDLPLKTISLSIGVAIFPADGDHISDLFQAADRALYASKQGGRNCYHTVRELSVTRASALEWPIRIHCEALIGRQQQWTLLQHHFSECKAGRGRLVFVTGEAGIGKTRLLRQFVRRQRAGDYHILYGECTEGTTIHSYAPMRVALKKGFEAKDPATVNLFRQLEPHCRRELIELVPQFDRFEKESQPQAKSPDRYLLLESILMLLQALSRQLPTVIVLEDIHWSDEATLNLLQYLARNIRSERILMIATFREEDAVHSPLPAVLHNMSRENLYETIQLKPLSPDDTGTMIEELFAGYTTYLSFKQWIHEETEGIPFYIEELIKLLLEEGYIQRMGNEVEARRPDKFLLPYSIRALVQRRINRLSESLQRVLGFASIIGYEFDLQILVRLIEENEGYLLDLLEQLVKLHLIWEVAEAGEERFRFRHNKIRDVIYEDMGLIKRKKFHRRVGEILESIHADELELYAEELAHHFEEGGVMKKAFTYSLEAGKKALQIHAYQDAQAHFDHCFQYGELMDTSGVELVAELYANKAATMEALASWEEAVRCYKQLYSLRKAAGSPKQQAAALNRLSRVYYMKEDFPNSQDSAQRALELARESKDPEESADAYYNLGKHHWRLCDYDRALECMKAAAENAARIPDDQVRARYLNSAGILCLEKSDYTAAQNYFQEAKAIYHQKNDKRGLLECQVNLSILRRNQGSLAVARKEILEASMLSQEIGDPYRIAACAVNQAELEIELADYQQANRLNERAGRIYNELSHSLGQTHYLQNEAHLHRIQANLDAALEAAYKARIIAEDRSLKRRAAELMVDEARILYFEGDWVHSLERLETVRGIFETQKDGPGRVEAEIKLGFVHLAMHDKAAARRHWAADLEPGTPSTSLEFDFWKTAAKGFVAAIDGQPDELRTQMERMRALSEQTASAELITLSRLLASHQLQVAGHLQDALLAAENAEQSALQFRQELYLTRIRLKRLELKHLLKTSVSREEVRTLLEAARTHPQQDVVYRCFRLLSQIDPLMPGLVEDRKKHWESWKEMVPEAHHERFQP